ncbi:RHS repeat-associated core domain-containing protein [Amycolatopsis sp. NPDC101161]|uniref:RHS repeat-associated core domain-containing protein n=1 Tax=Amycolatopsis sp. NPDC101161 TaxID=3363940 RepID=UPI0037F346C9
MIVRRARFRLRATAAGVVLVLLGSAQSAAAATGTGWHGLGWDLPPLQQTASVKGADGGFLPVTKPKAMAPAAVAQASWPTAGSSDVDLSAPGGTGQVKVARAGQKQARAAAAKGTVKVTTLDQTTAAKAGIKGVLMQVAPVSGDTGGPLQLDLDYQSFGAAYGGGFGDRLHLVQYPSCLLSTPDRPECRVGTPLASDNNSRTHHVTGEVALPTTTAQAATAEANTAAAKSAVVAAVAGTAGGGGNFGATDLKPAGSWTAGGSSADFRFSYPITTPSWPGGTVPSISLDYSSSAVDGLTSATNNQASGIGDGWGLSGGGFIERSYKGCSQDLGGNNGQTKTGDLCWFNDNATISFSGASGDLVLDKATGTWHPKDDDGTRVERLTNTVNGDKFNEYWKVTTPNGTQYFFGLNRLPGWASGKGETQSTWTVPVFGNNSGEPCNAATYAASWCQRAWRWNLDYVVDPHGNAVSYYYQPETNNYGLNRNASTANDPGTPYTRGGYLTKIEYGFNTTLGDVFGHAPVQVLFDTSERCVPSGTVTCDPGQLNSGTATSWPDVPSEQICAQGAVCVYGSPTFFSRKRYTKIRTQITDGGSGWKPVNDWALGQSFPAGGDGSPAALWLDSITQTGRVASPYTVGNAITLNPTTFHGVLKANRVNANSQYTAITRNRIDAITNPQGGITTITYADPECVPGVKMPASPESNTLSCYPVYWTPGGATDPVLDWFNKFRVTDVLEDGRTVLSQVKRTHYDYLGGAAWHHDDNPLTDPKYRTWSDWRGYGDVKTTVGQAGSDPAGPPVVSESIYLRGMDGDTLPGGGTRSVSVSSDNWKESIADRKELRGFVRETVSYLNGKPIGGALNDPWVSDPTATDADGRAAAYVGTETSRTRTWLDAANTWRVARTHTTFGKYGLATHVQTEPDTADPKQTTCSITQYLENTTDWLLTSSSEVQKVSGPCDETANPPGPDNIITDTRTCYDDQALGVAPKKGNVTRIDGLQSWAAGSAETFKAPASTSVYDVYGRVTSATDALGLTTTTAYTPATGGPVTRIVTTSPPISATNTTKLTEIKDFDPVSGALTGEANQSGLRTDATFDALGRTLSAWKPGHSKAANAPADVTYSYTVSNTGPSTIVTAGLLANGQYASSYSLVDGLGRTVQAQNPAPDDSGGRVVTDSIYDSQGRAWKNHSSYWNSTAPGSTLLVVQDNAVPNTNATTYDSAGRAIATAYLAKGAEQWRTTTIPDGDRTTTLPPAGGTATTTITNGLGQRTQLLQYKDPTRTSPGSPADTTTYTYTRSGQQASITDTTGKNVWTFAYDLNDRKISSSDPDTGTTTFTYDDAGKLTSTTDARHRQISYTYDNLGRKTAEYDGDVTSGTKLAEWTYDTLLPGLPTASIRYADGKTYRKDVAGYDTAGRSTGTTVTIPAGETGLAGTYQFGVTYDPNSGAVRTMTSPAVGRLPDEEMSFGYSTLGVPLTMLAADSSGGATQLVSQTKYNPMGQVLRTNYQDAANPNQVSVTNTYEDGTNRLATTQAQRATSSNYWIANRVYTYNPSGSITKIADTPADAPADVQCFRQDYLQRLTDAWTPSSSDCATSPTTAGTGGAASYWTSWTFDDMGNRKTQVQHTGAGDITTTSTYPASGDSQPHAVQATTTTGPAGTTQAAYSYDRTGSTKSRGPDGAAQTFTYDAEGHVATATEANGAASSYLYDADGALLIAREPTGTTLTVGDTELNVPTGGTKALGTRFYSYNGQVIATRKGDVGLTWKLSDHLGTTYATVDAGNLAVSKRWQDPYGLTRGAPPSTWPDKHGYVGGYQTTTGLTHLGARDYDPATGRFLSVDPLLNPADPQSMNGYGYSDANPVNLSDPSGLYVVGGEDPNTGVPYGVSYNDHGGATLVGIFPESELAGAALLNPGQARQQRAYHARVRRAELNRHLSKYSPTTNDYVRLQNYWSMIGTAYNDRDFWDTATGAGSEHACFGARGCQMAWIHLEENPNDIEGAKSIAAFYCVENYEECAHTKFWDDNVHQMFQDLLMLGAMGLGGAGSAADGEAAAATGVGGAARAEVEAETAAAAQRTVKTDEAGVGAGWYPETGGKLPEGWGEGKPNKKGVGFRWQDPKNQGNGVRIDQGNPNSPFPSQQVDHVIVRVNGKVIGRDGNPISGAIDQDPTNAHIPLSEWQNWSSWSRP